MTASVAKIPWMGSSFVGLIVGVWHGGRLFRFTTYTGAKLACFESWRGGARFVLADREHEVTVEVDGALPAALKAPRHGKMVARADESLGAVLRVSLRSRRDGTVLFEGEGGFAGVEVMDAEGELGAGVPRCST